MNNDKQPPPARHNFEYIIPRLEKALDHQKALYKKKPTFYRLKQVNRIAGLLNQWLLEKQEYDARK